MVENIGYKSAGALGPLQTMTQTPLIVLHASSPWTGREEEKREEEGKVGGREGKREGGMEEWRKRKKRSVSFENDIIDKFTSLLKWEWMRQEILLIIPHATPACVSFRHSVCLDGGMNPRAAHQCRRFVSEKSTCVIVRVDS